ncbi:MAG: cysteine synthase family protein [Cyanobacteria bacterium P01_H01_bin.105]
MNVPRLVDLIGNTPLIDLSFLTKKKSASLYAKCEFMNPGASMKDRIASHILDVAEAKGDLSKGDTIVCASSGNTGCSFAMLGAIRGYSVIIITSSKCSLEKQNHIKALDAQLIVVKKNEDYMAFGDKLAAENGYFNVDQYNNPYNPETYYKTLGPEIWKDTDGKVTHFVMTGSTFGCISGTGRFLKQKNPNIKIILADPVGSNIYDYYYKSHLSNKPFYQANKSNTSIIEGAGKSKPTQCLDFSVIDEVIQVADYDAISTCHELAKREGLLLGGSSGINVFAARELARLLPKESTVVTILCDNGIKYLSKIYNQSFLLEKFEGKSQKDLCKTAV